MTRSDIKINKNKVIDSYKAGAFDYNCGDFMKLRALIMLGFIDELNNLGIMENGKYILDGTLSKSYFPKERVGKPSKWVTFYALLAEKYAKRI